MIDFSKYRFSDHVNQELKKLDVDFVFQPIVDRNGNVIAREALMRPNGASPLELISQFEETDDLHILEVASAFGATEAFISRGYKERLGINSFPSEALTDWENKLYLDEFVKHNIDISLEMLEYPHDLIRVWEQKQRNYEGATALRIVIDDFGTGANDMDAVELYKPYSVKFDRKYITDIDKNKDAQAALRDWIKLFHSKGIIAVAEGVETEEEYDTLFELGIDYFQGFYIGMPE